MIRLNKFCLRISKLFWLIGFVSLQWLADFPVWAADSQEVYTFTDRSGRKMEAIILQYHSDTVELERIRDRRRFTVPLDRLIPSDQDFLANKFAETPMAKTGDSIALIPGEVLTLEFPELGMMAKNQPAKCELSIPQSYDPLRPVPLLVWFSGGSGSYQVSSAKGIVDFDRFLVLSLPYPKGSSTLRAVETGKKAINQFWEFQQPMLQRVIKMVPNISKKVRIAAGANNGAHLVGSELDQKWRNFCNYFTGYVMYEGGYCPDMKFSGTRSTHRILFIYGDTSGNREWQESFIKRIDQARGRIDYLEVPNAGSKLTEKGKQKIRQWIEETFAKGLS